MLKLRILLLRRLPYYIILLLALVYFIISNYVIVKESKIASPVTRVEGIIDKIVNTIDGVKLEIVTSFKERIVIKYYYKEDNNITFNYKLGDLVLIIGEEQVINNNTVPNTFNYKKYLYRKGIFHVVLLDNIILLKNNNNLLYKIKNSFYQRTKRLVKSSAYIDSLLFGNNNYLDDEIINTYRENGISHLFAISGLHIGLFIKIIEFVLKKIKIRENKRYVFLIVFLVFYMIITNFPMSVVRASVFTILMIVNKIFYFNIKPVYLLYLTISLITFVNPFVLHEVGLQYSVVISFFLLLNQNEIQNDNYFISLFKTSIIAFLASLPITTFHFYQVNVLSILYNLLFIPFISFIILPLVMISYLLPFLDSILFFFIKILEFLSVNLNKIDIGKLIFMKCNMLVIILFYIILILFSLSKNKKVLFIIVLLIVFYYFYPSIKKEKYYLMFDVGQGDSSLFVLDNNVTLIDTGGYLPYKDSYKSPIAKNKIIPYLKSKGIKKLDNLILTHGDSDHMQDAKYLVNNFKVNNVYVNCNNFNELENDLNSFITLTKLYINEKINIGGYNAISLNDCDSDENKSSIVLYIVIDGYKMLFLGDISTSEELDMINKYNLSNIDMVKLAHHGSKTSSDYRFLKTINPSLALISVGLNNRFNHPSAIVTNNLQSLNINYLETRYSGSIRIDLNSKHSISKFKDN